MSIIKSFSVDNGDMFYIDHNSPNFTIIDCNINDGNRKEILKEIKDKINYNEISRFISTHPDEDHIKGLEFIDDEIGITNFYCVKNNAEKEVITSSFKKYKELRDSDRAFYIEKNCERKWMNIGDDTRNSSGINILWPNTDNIDFQKELEKVENKESPNDISAIISYGLKNGVKALWMGDLSKEFLERIKGELRIENVDVLFPPHHSRKSGKIPTDLLNRLNPKLIVVGEGDSKDIEYYDGFKKITQNRAGNIVFRCVTGEVHVYVSNLNYTGLDFPKRLEYAEYQGYKYLGYFKTFN